MLDLFTPVVGAERQHPVFQQLCAPEYGPERAVLSNWCEGFEDRDGKFVREFQTTYESSVWELYVHACLKNLGGIIDFGHSVPDFVADFGGDECTIEATIAQPKQGDKPAFGLGPPDVPDDLNAFNFDAMVRFCNAFTAKSKRYQESYSSYEHVCDKPFVLAFSPFDRPSSQLAHNRPIIAALYGVYFDEEETIASGSHQVIRRRVSSIDKSPTTTLPIGYFCDDEFAHISAVIYSPIAGMGKIRALAKNSSDQLFFTTFRPNSNALKPIVQTVQQSNYEEHLLDGLYVMHNPHAAVPLSSNAITHDRIAHVWPDDGGQPQTFGPSDFLQIRTVMALRTRKS